HRTIPVATPRCNGVVESLHGRIEQELYKTEPITCERELSGNTGTYLLFHHFLRPHRGLPYPDGRSVTPYQFLQSRMPEALASWPFLPPIILDKIPLRASQLIYELIPQK
ncbi:MAG: hypothetical protein NUW13_03065, partial [candidate division KSB1 bacterium]|nr:hypothetical protein [candidate division KSB1 bacterium]